MPIKPPGTPSECICADSLIAAADPYCPVHGAARPRTACPECGGDPGAHTLTCKLAAQGQAIAGAEQRRAEREFRLEALTADCSIIDTAVDSSKTTSVPDDLGSQPGDCTCPDMATLDVNCPSHGTARALTVEYGDPAELITRPPLLSGLEVSTGRHARRICKKAADLVNGDRNADYGDALDNFTETAALWSPILGIEVTAEQVALCMAQVKIARLIHNTPHDDSWVDGVGYLALGGGIARRRRDA